MCCLLEQMNTGMFLVAILKHAYEHSVSDLLRTSISSRLIAVLSCLAARSRDWRWQGLNQLLYWQANGQGGTAFAFPPKWAVVRRPMSAAEAL